MADLHTASILSLVAGILIVLSSIVTAAMGGVFMVIPFAGAMIMAMGVVGIIFGLIVIYGSTLMKKQGKAQTGGILVLIFSILSIIGGAGFLIGFILGLVGSILALTAKK
ncbi:MAG: hypothetical protein HY369_04785 [Candidatus Aenigmarchaeota archaeon]|nr:hypothetical protein [Candidatus Aenigmarchaeota archaeon]